MAVCTFIGHREVYDAKIESMLQEAAEQVVEKYETVEFMLYPLGDLFSCCLLAALRARTRRPLSVTITLVFDDKEHQKDTLCNPGHIPPCMFDKALIPLADFSRTRRDHTLPYKKMCRWLIQNADCIIGYEYESLLDIDTRALDSARRAGKEIIPVASPETAQAIADAFPLMSEREQFIYRKQCEGCKMKDIAAELGVSPERARQILSHGLTTVRARLPRVLPERYRLHQLSKDAQAGRSCALFDLGEATDASLSRFQAIVNYLIHTYGVSDFCIEQSLVLSSFTSMLSDYAAGRRSIRLIPYTSSGNPSEAAVHLLEQTDFCICDLASCPDALTVRKCASRSKRAALLDMGTSGSNKTQFAFAGIAEAMGIASEDDIQALVDEVRYGKGR